MRGWVEIWTRPGAASFEAVIVDPPFERASFTRTLSGVGAGELVLPADYDRLDEIILTDLTTPANNVRTLVRVFFDDGTTTPAVAYEFFADSLERLEGPDGLVLVSGPGIESVLSDARVEPYDWDGSSSFTSEFPDWVWGGADAMRSVSVDGLAKVPDVWEIGTDGTGGTFTLTLNGNTTAAIAYNATTNTIEGAVQATDLGNVDAVVDGGEGTIDQPWRLAINLPTSGNTLSADFTGVTGDTEQVFQKVQTGGYDGSNVDGWTVAQFADGRATPQLFGTYEFPPLRVVTTGLPAGATYGIEVRGASQFAGIQKVMNVTAGGLYHSRLVFRTPSAIDKFRAVVRDPVADGEATPIAKFPAAASSFLPGANVLYQIDMDGILIPEGVNQIIDRLAYVGTGDPQTFTLYPELSYFREGQPPTTIGDIVIQLMEDADGTNHAGREVWRNVGDTNTWLDYSSFTDALDSNGAAWTDAELSVIVKRGKPYGQMLVDLAQLGGYEWEIIPDPVSPGNWLLNVYNADGIGTDRTALTTPQIFGEESVGGARLYRRHPPGSNVAVEGTGQISARANSAGAVTAYGRRETYVPDLDITTLTDAGLKATQTISAYLRKSQPITLSRQPRYEDPFPLVAYQIGDTVNVSEPPFMAKDGRRLVQVVWALEADSETVTESFGAVSYVGQAAINQGVFQLLNEFKPIREPDLFQPVQAGGGGVIPWLVAASDSPEVWKASAAYQCSGVNDEVVINAAITQLEGFVALAPGNYYCESVASGGHSIELGNAYAGALVGMGGMAYPTIFQSDSGKTAPGALVHVPDFCRLQNIYIETTDCAAVRLSGGEGHVLDNWLVGGIEVTTGISGIFYIRGNYIWGNGTDPALNLTGDRYLIEANQINGQTGPGLFLTDNMSGSVISGNTFYQCSVAVTVGDTNPLATYGIVLASNNFLACDVGIRLNEATLCSVTGNLVFEPEQHGIWLTDSKRCDVVGNHVAQPSQQTTNTYDGIFLDGDSDENSVTGNTVAPSRTTEDTRYGINVSAATCENNVVADNWLGEEAAYGTASYNNAGTGTITARDANGQFSY